MKEMKEIHLGRVLAENRRRRGITQDELAEFMGVSKAAVSKWETEISYPDILLLPRLAAYFDLSIDELMGYEPQMDKEGIRKMHRSIAEEFASGSFDMAVEHCREYAKKYYSCYPLLFQIASLLVNHSVMASDQQERERLLEEAAGYCRRVKQETDDLDLGQNAHHMEAYCMLALGRPEEALALLEPEPPERIAAEPLLALAWTMKGNTRAAKKILQAAIYKNVTMLVSLFTSYMDICKTDREKFEESCLRLRGMAEIFRLEELHPGNMFACYLTMAQGWTALGENEKALEVLERYADLAGADIYPLHLRGDDYFDLLDEWLDENLSLGEDLPRDESVIRCSMMQAVSENPAFAELKEEPRFRRIMGKLARQEEI